MKRFYLYFLLLLTPLLLQAKTDEEFFAKVVAPNKGNIYTDDSTIVSVYLYAVKPIGDIQVDDKNLKIKGCKVRKAYQGNGSRQSVTTLDGKRYYTVICAQYYVTGNDKGSCAFPSLSITANLYTEEKKQQQSDPFFGPFDDFFRTPTYKKEKKSIHSPQFKLQVSNEPQKTTEELRKSGKVVI